jgi:hypothetical protein
MSLREDLGIFLMAAGVTGFVRRWWASRYPERTWDGGLTGYASPTAAQGYAEGGHIRPGLTMVRNSSGEPERVRAFFLDGN